MNVIIPSPGYQIHENEIIIAPADLHLVLGKNRQVLLLDGEKLHGVRPAADCTMLSLIHRREDHLMGVVLDAVWGRMEQRVLDI